MEYITLNLAKFDILFISDLKSEIFEMELSDFRDELLLMFKEFESTNNITDEMFDFLDCEIFNYIKRIEETYTSSEIEIEDIIELNYDDYLNLDLVSLCANKIFNDLKYSEKAKENAKKVFYEIIDL